MPTYLSGEFLKASAPAAYLNKGISSRDVDDNEARERLLSASGDKVQSQRASVPHLSKDEGADTTQSKKRGKTLGVMALCCLTYYSVSGGPFGFESVVQAGAHSGHWQVLRWFLWALPEALITIEMSIVFPEASGSVAWVEAARGRVGFIKGWLSLLSGIADNSLYPLLFVDCAVQLFMDDDGNVPLQDSPQIRYAITMTITLALAYLNYRGLDLIGKLSVYICLFSLMPFVVFCIVGSFKVVPSRWAEGRRRVLLQ